MDFLEQVKKTVYQAIGDLMQLESTARMSSSTLRRELVVSLDLANVPGAPDRIVLRLPYYWAEYAHDGRKQIDLPPGKFMVFFPDKRDDPRTYGGASYPRSPEEAKTRSQLLTDEEFKRFRAENYQRKKAGLSPIMVITPRVGKAEGEFFFSLAWEQLVASGTVDAIIEAGLSTYLESLNPGIDRDGTAIDL